LGAGKVVFLTPTATNPAVTENRPYVFRMCFSDKDVAERMADLVVEQLKPKSIGVLHNVSSPYSDYLSRTFIATMQSKHQKKGIPLIEEKVLRRGTDFSSGIDRFVAAQVSHVVMFTHDGDLIRFLTQSHGKRFYPVYIGSDGWG